MGAWRSYCSREKEHKDGGSVDRMEQLWVHAWRSSCSRVELLQERAITTCTGGKINNLQEEEATSGSREPLQHRGAGEISYYRRKDQFTTRGRSYNCKEEPLPHRGLLQEAGVTTGGRCRGYYIKEGVNTASGRRRSYRREDQYPARGRNYCSRVSYGIREELLQNY